MRLPRASQVAPEDLTNRDELKSADQTVKVVDIEGEAAMRSRAEVAKEVEGGAGGKRGREGVPIQFPHF